MIVELVNKKTKKIIDDNFNVSSIPKLQGTLKHKGKNYKLNSILLRERKNKDGEIERKTVLEVV